MYSLHGLDFLVRVRCLNSSQQQTAGSGSEMATIQLYTPCAVLFASRHTARTVEANDT